MSYSTQAQMARDNDLLLRVAACAANEGVKDPEQWAWKHQWEVSAQPGWDDAYAYAINAAVEYPGAQGTVISDAMILSGVQSIHAAEATPAS